MRALFLRRVLLHRSTRADLVYCVASLATFGAILGWAIVSTSWIGDGVAAFLATHFGEWTPQAPALVLDALRTLALFLAYDLGFFVDHTLKHRIPALWELHKTHHSAEVLTPLVNFRVHPLDSPILANNLSLFIGVIGGAATWALGRQATSFLMFDDNALMILYIYLTAQLQHTQIWIPFTGIWGASSRAPPITSCTTPPIRPTTIATWARASRCGTGFWAACACRPRNRHGSLMALRASITIRTARSASSSSRRRSSSRRSASAARPPRGREKSARFWSRRRTVSSFRRKVATTLVSSVAEVELALKTEVWPRHAPPGGDFAERRHEGQRVDKRGRLRRRCSIRGAELTRRRPSGSSR